MDSLAVIQTVIAYLSISSCGSLYKETFPRLEAACTPGVWQAAYRILRAVDRGRRRHSIIKLKGITQCISAYQNKLVIAQMYKSVTTSVSKDTNRRYLLICSKNSPVLRNPNICRRFEAFTAE